MVPLGDGSFGDGLVGEPERFLAVAVCGGDPIVKCSPGLVVVDIINYLALTLIRSMSPVSRVQVAKRNPWQPARRAVDVVLDSQSGLSVETGRGGSELVNR